MKMQLFAGSTWEQTNTLASWVREYCSLMEVDISAAFACGSLDTLVERDVVDDKSSTVELPEFRVEEIRTAIRIRSLSDEERKEIRERSGWDSCDDIAPEAVLERGRRNWWDERRY